LRVFANVLVGKSRFGPGLDIKAHDVHEPGNEKLGGEAGGSGRGESLAKDAFDASIPPLASGTGQGVTHALPDFHGDGDIGRSPNRPPLVVGQIGIPEHANLEFKEPQLVLVHVANDNLGRSFNGVIENNISGGANAENNVVLGDFENLLIDRRIFPTNVVNVGAIANGINHVEALLDESANDEKGEASDDRHGPGGLRVDGRQGLDAKVRRGLDHVFHCKLMVMMG
jgi:hypothetical protein